MRRSIQMKCGRQRRHTSTPSAPLLASRTSHDSGLMTASGMKPKLSPSTKMDVNTVVIEED
jgi:hypothetical protein